MPKTLLSVLLVEPIESVNELLQFAFLRQQADVKTQEEAYAANCLLVNGTVLAPAGFPKVKGQIAALGYPIIEVEMSEFRKMDGGLTCLSLVFDLFFLLFIVGLPSFANKDPGDDQGKDIKH